MGVLAVSPKAWLAAALMLTGCGATSRSHDLGPSFGEGMEALRPDNAASDFPHFSAGETVESVVSPGGHYRIHFTRSGVDAVPSADADQNGTPDFVDTVATTYDQVLARYEQLGFRRPPDDSAITTGNGGDGLFDVYLLDFAGRADGAYRMDMCFTADVGCAGYMVQENDFAGYGYPSTTVATEILASHEMFHGVQAAYNPNQGSVIAEGTAVWATELFKPSLSDFEGFVGGYLSRPDKTLTLDPVGPVQDFSYGSAILFEFLSERFGEEIIRKLWEDCVPGARGVAEPKWLAALDALLRREYQSSFAEAFREFTRWNLFTGGRADPQRGYARGSGYPIVAIEAKTFPSDVSARMALASARYFQAPADGRTRIAAEWVSEDTTGGIAVTLATVQGTRIVAVTSSETAHVEMDVAAGDGVVFFATNPALAGSGQTGFLCAGSPEEVAACREAHFPSEPPDAGTTDDRPAKQGCANAGASGSCLAVLLLLLLRRGAALRTASGHR